MRVYLAARYSRREELAGYRERLQAAGHEVTSRWLNGDHQVSDAGLNLGDDPEADQFTKAERERFALEDMADVIAADMLIAFTEPPRSTASRGGRHVEFGFALAQGMLIAVVGPRENVFHCLPGVMQFDTFDAFLQFGTRPLPIVDTAAEPG
jgi:nucleoside 2-deoxyribosyltransferase